MKITIETIVLVFSSLFPAMSAKAQPVSESFTKPDREFRNTNRMIEIRSYNLKPGTGNEFHKLFLEQALPLQQLFSLPMQRIIYQIKLWIWKQ